MDIRSFFSAAGAKKPKSDSSKNETKSDAPLKDKTPGVVNKKLTPPKSKSQPVTKSSNTKEVKSVEKIKKPSQEKESKPRDKISSSTAAKKKKKVDYSAKHVTAEDRAFICDNSSESDYSEEEVVPIEVESKKESSKKKESAAAANRIKPNDIFSIDDSDDDSPVKKVSSAKKRKKEKKQVVSEDEFEDEEVVGRRSKKKKKGKNAKNAKNSLVINSDSEEDITPEKKKSRKKKEYVSDEEDPNRPTVRAAFARVKPKPSEPITPVQVEKVKADKKSPVKQAVSIGDFFGGGAVHRVERPTPTPNSSSKRKAETSPEIDDFDDFEMHDDDDFAKTLEMLDSQQPAKKLKSDPSSSPKKVSDSPKKVSPSPKKVTQSPKKSSPSPKKEEPKLSLASKLSSKVNSSSKPPNKGVVFTEDSPVKQSSSSSAESKTPSNVERKSPKKKDTPAGKLARSESKPESTPSKHKLNNDKKDAEDHEETEIIADTPTVPKKGGGYRAYLNREAPQALGSKEIPVGADNCLEGLTFVITGVLESMERDDAKSLIERYGGKVTGSISKKTSYIIIGRDAGESKTAKADQFGTKKLDEDGLLDLVRTMPGKKSKYVVAAEKAAEKDKSTSVQKKQPPPVTVSTTKPSSAPSSSFSSPSNSQSSQNSKKTLSPQKATSSESLLWVDKYKPQTMKQIIGQQGDKSNAKKLLNWLKSWHRNRAIGAKPAFNRFNDDGSGHKAALLSGPPGVGKTTTAHIVCKEAGFKFVELNASDTRSKKSMDTVVSELLSNNTISGCFGEKAEKMDPKTHCLVMDEVDGMAGNEDRGGMSELIQLIKNSKIPIICMCNDRNHQKIRSLANYTFDLRFQRPRVEQIKAAMMSLAFKEGLKIPPPALNEMILGANHDVRQVIHNLCMWSADSKSLDFDKVKAEAAKAKKDTKMGPFDACRKVFVGGEETANMSLMDKSDLFFYDYSFHPLFVQENYISVTPFAARGDPKKHLKLIAQAADSIANGDLVDRQIRSKQAWSLLPLQAIYSSVIPGEFMRGGIGQMVQFPSWLGKNSSRGKTDRILQELRTHMSLHVSGDKKSLIMDYLPQMRKRLTSPLVKQQTEGVPEVIDFMDKYDINREDFDNILDVTSWPHLKDPMTHVETKTKSAFTRTYNKECHLTPYAAVVGAKKKRGGGGGASDEFGEDDGSQAASDGDKSDDDVAMDAMIKAKAKKKTAAKPSSSKASSSGKGKTSAKAPAKASSKGKGKGKK